MYICVFLVKYMTDERAKTLEPIKNRNGKEKQMKEMICFDNLFSIIAKIT